MGERMKRAILKISTDLFCGLFKRTKYPALIQVDHNPLPDDARITDVQSDLSRPGLINMAVESDSFNEVPLGNCCEELPSPMLRSYYPPEPYTSRAKLDFDRWWSQQERNDEPALRTFAERVWHAATGQWIRDQETFDGEAKE